MIRDITKAFSKIFKGTRKKGNVIYIERYNENDVMNLMKDIRWDIRMEQYFSRRNIKFPDFIIDDGLNKLMEQINEEESIVRRKNIKKSVIVASIFLSVTVLPLMLVESNPEAGDDNIFQRIIAFRDKLFTKSEKLINSENEINPPPENGDVISNTYYSFEELYKSEDVFIYELKYIPVGYSLSYIEYNNLNNSFDIKCCYENSNNNVLTIIQNINFNNKNFNFLINKNTFKILNIDNNDIYINISDSIVTGMCLV